MFPERSKPRRVPRLPTGTAAADRRQLAMSTPTERRGQERDQLVRIDGLAQDRVKPRLGHRMVIVLAVLAEHYDRNRSPVLRLACSQSWATCGAVVVCAIAI